MTKPRLSVVCTPIGNLGDLSDRVRDTLSEAAGWIVEDTRVSGKLASHLGLKKPMKVLNDHTSPAAVEQLLAWVESTGHVAVLTDGGAPTVSDPGTTIVDLAHDAGIPVDVIPGPSAVIAALAVSGFFGQRFTFLGFPPRKAGDVRNLFGPFADSTQSIIFFESPFRVLATMKVLAEVFPGRRYAICRELTKLYEQVYRGAFPDLPTEGEVPMKGEFTIVIEGKRAAKERAISS